MTGFSTFDIVALLASAILRRRIAEADAERLRLELLELRREQAHRARLLVQRPWRLLHHDAMRYWTGPTGDEVMR